MSIPSPTLRQLLQHEFDTNVHPNLPYLKEKSAASGLLWAKRQLHYQTSTFANSLEVPLRFLTPKDAAIGAYKEVYDDHHGWAVKQIFFHSFGGSPPLEKIFKSMDPPQRLPRDKTDALEPIPQRKLSDVSEDDEENEDNEFLMALEEFGKVIVDKWDDALRLFNCLSDDEKPHSSINNVLSSESHLRMYGLDTIVEDANPADSSSTSSKMDKDLSSFASVIEQVKAGSAEFVAEIRPLVSDLGGLIDEFNMNDPSKV
jgi:hypothetical protein